MVVPGTRHCGAGVRDSRELSRKTLRVPPKKCRSDNPVHYKRYAGATNSWGLHGLDGAHIRFYLDASGIADIAAIQIVFGYCDADQTLQQEAHS